MTWTRSPLHHVSYANTFYLSYVIYLYACVLVLTPGLEAATTSAAGDVAAKRGERPFFPKDRSRDRTPLHSEVPNHSSGCSIIWATWATFTCGEPGNQLPGNQDVRSWPCETVARSIEPGWPGSASSNVSSDHGSSLCMYPLAEATGNQDAKVKSLSHRMLSSKSATCPTCAS